MSNLGDLSPSRSLAHTVGWAVRMAGILLLAWLVGSLLLASLEALDNYNSQYIDVEEGGATCSTVS